MTTEQHTDEHTTPKPFRGVPAAMAKYDRLYVAYGARTRRHMAALQQIADLAAENARLRIERNQAREQLAAQEPWRKEATRITQLAANLAEVRGQYDTLTTAITAVIEDMDAERSGAEEKQRRYAEIDWSDRIEALKDYANRLRRAIAGTTTATTPSGRAETPTTKDSPGGVVNHPHEVRCPTCDTYVARPLTAEPTTATHQPTHPDGDDEDFRMQVVMALCTEDQDEERTDEEVIAYIRRLIATDHEYDWAMAVAGPRGDKPLQVIVAELKAERDEARQPLLDLAEALIIRDLVSPDAVDSPTAAVGHAAATFDRLAAERDAAIQAQNELDEQIKRLAEVIMFEVPGEPSQGEGAVSCAIRLIRQGIHDAKARTESADTIAALRKAGDEQGAEIRRLQDEAANVEVGAKQLLRMIDRLSDGIQHIATECRKTSKALAAIQDISAADRLLTVAEHLDALLATSSTTPDPETSRT